MAAMCPFHASAAVMAATAGIVTLLLRNFRGKRPQRAEMVPNRGLWNRAVVAAVKAVAVERGDDPHGPRFDFVGSIGQGVKGTLQVVAGSSFAVGKQLSIDSDSICVHLDLVAGKRDGWLEKGSSAIGASPRSTVLTAEGDRGRCSLRAELHQVCAGRMADDVKAARQRGSEIATDAENPAR